MTLLPESWNKELINKNSEINWVQETANQLLKDFNMLDIPLALKSLGDESYGDLFNQVKHYLEVLHKTQYEAFLNLLYRIDVPEITSNHLLAESSNSDYYSNLTEVVLFREFMKVVYRHRYSH